MKTFRTATNNVASRNYRWNFRAAAVMAALLLWALPSTAGITVVSLRGDVTVRRGVSEQWTAVAVGDALRPEDSIRLGEGSSATVTIETTGGAGTGGRTITFPPSVIVDMADLRKMTRGDLLMKLAMEDIRSAPKGPSGGGDEMPKTTTTRGSDRDRGPSKAATGGSLNELRLNGAGVLYDNGFYGPCVLRSREVLRIEPSLASRVDSRLLMAGALEKMDLDQEAYEAYRSLAEGKLTSAEKTLVEKKLRELKDTRESGR